MIVVVISIALLAVFALDMVRRLRVVLAALKRLRADVEPLAQEIADEAAKASRRAAVLAERSPSRGADDRIRS